MDKGVFYFYIEGWTVCWRARNVAGWVGVSTARKRACEELAVMLYIALRGLQPQSNGVLGDNTILQQVGLGWLKDWFQDIVDK